MKVRATRIGYYEHVRRREGDVFTIKTEKEFSKIWMEKVSKGTPERVTTAQAALNSESSTIKRDRTPGAESPSPVASNESEVI